jgi:membrane protease YdiL (CAAX protease family)
MINFFIGIVPISFIATWVYVKNNRSIYASMIFHLFVNLLQERIAMTNTTKCVQTFVLYIAAGIVVLLNKDMYFGTDHIGRLLPEESDAKASKRP